MQSLLARPPYWFALIAAGAGLLAVAAKVYVGEWQVDPDAPDFPWPFLSELLGVVAGALFAAAGLSGLASFVLGPYWKGHTSDLVKTYAQQAVDALADIALACVIVAVRVNEAPVVTPLREGGDPNEKWRNDVRAMFKVVSVADGNDRQLADAYRDHQARYAGALNGMKERMGSFAAPSSDVAAARRMVEAVAEVAADADRRADRCATLLEKLGRYRDEQAVKLEVQAAGLRDSTLELLRYAEADHDISGRSLAVVVQGLFRRVQTAHTTVAEILNKDDRGAYISPTEAFEPLPAAAQSST